MKLPSSARRLAAFALVLTTSLVAACGDSPGPDESSLEGRYELRGIEDTTNAGEDTLIVPPFVVGGSLFTTIYLVSGDLEFRTRGRLTDAREFQTRANNTGDPTGPNTFSSETISYQASGSRLVVNRVYGATVYSDTGQIVGDSLIRLRVKTLNNSGPVPPPSGPGRVIRYVRVAGP